MPIRRTPLPDGDIGNWGNLLNDYLRQISDVSAGNTAGNFRGGLNNWTTAGRPTSLYSYTKTGGAGSETLGTDHEGLTGINTTTGQLEKWTGTAWITLTYPNLVNNGTNLSITATTTSTSSTTGALTVGGGLGVAENLNVGGGNLNLTNGTSNLLTFGNIAGGAPTFTTRSAGTKLLLWNNLTAAASDYAIGMQANNIWFSVPASNTSLGFKWYGGTTNIATLDGTGNFTIANKLTAANLQITTGATSGYVLVSDAGGNATWQVASGGSATPAGANTQIQFNNAGAFGANANLVWDNTNSRLGIGVASPSAKLQVNGTVYMQGNGANIGTVANSYFDSFRLPSGLLTAWNYSNGQGEVDFMSVRNTGSGGFYFYDLPNTTGTAPTFLMAIRGDGNVGIGTTTPTAKLTVLAENIGTENIVDFTHYGDSSNAPVLRFRKARGTLATPTAIQSGDQLGSVNFTGYNGTALTGSRSSVLGYASENFTSTANGAGLTFATTLNTTITPFERMRIDHAGNVGIGTTAPAAKLHVADNSTQGTIQLGGTTTTGYYSQIFQNGNNLDFIANGDQAYRVSVATNNGTGNLRFFTAYGSIGNTERMRIDGGGNVGIGTTVSAALLQVGTRSTATTPANNSTIGVFGGSGTGIITNLTLHNNATGVVGNGASLSFTLATAYSATASISAAIENITTANSSLIFSSYDSSNGGLAEKMRILGSGNVGIGTTSPISKLHVVGGIIASGASYAGNIQFENTGKTGAGLSTKYVLFNMASGDGGGTSQNGFHIYSYNNSTFKSIPFTILDNDNVGIGTTAPTSKLHVVGTTLCLTTTGATSIPLAATVNTQAGLEIRAITTTGAPSSVGTAHISFHRPGLFAANFGLDTDNSFAFGGWSSGAGYTKVKTGRLVAYGDIFNEGGYVYPGRADSSGISQSNWYLGSHASYGLYTNTGLYAASHLYTAGAIQTINNITPTGGAIRLTPNLHLNSGVGNGVYLNWDSGAGTATNPAFAVGNGAAAELMRVNYDGNVGIGIAPSQTYKLSVSSQAIGNYIALFSNTGNTANSNGVVIFAGNNSGTTGATIMLFGRADGVIVGSISQATANSVFYNTTSDIRLKENIFATSFGLADFMKIKVVDYNYIDDNSAQTGLIAQEIHKIIPTVVNVGGDDVRTRPWGIDYGKLTPFIIKAVQEQQTQINNLGSVNIESFKTEIRTQNQELNTKIETLKGETVILQSESVLAKTELTNFGTELTKSKTELGDLKSQFDNSKTEATNLKTEIANLKTESLGIVTKNQAQQVQIDNLETKTLELKTDLAKMTTENQTLKTGVETLENVNKTLKADLTKLTAEINNIKYFVNYPGN